MTPPAPGASRGAPLAPLEIASGIVTGRGPGHPAGRRSDPLGSPLAALLTAVRPAVRRAPCLVSFSGGYDSSLVLAAAVRVARQDGLPDPVPVTIRAGDAPEADESSWQEAIVEELGVADWVRIEAGDELDFVGPVASALTRRHGLLYPANTHFHGPMIDRAAGGALLTGVGGDQIFGLWRWRGAADVLARRTPLRPRSALQVVRSRLPLAARQAVERRRDHDRLELPWLGEAHVRAVARARADDRSSEPPVWRERVAWQATHRRLTLGLDALDRIGAAADVQVVHPFVEPGFVDAVARAGGRDGLGRRSTAFAAWFGDLVPRALSGRQTKATFGEVFWRDASREAARSWTGDGLGSAVAELVVADRLAAEWAAGDPSLLTALLLQHATLVRDR